MLLNQPPILFKVYAFLRMRMDFATGIAGAHPHTIDEASINHAIYYPGGHGRKKSPPITRSKIRWYISCLEKLGLIERVGIFVFRLIFASLYNSVEIQYDPNTTAATTFTTSTTTANKISNKTLRDKGSNKSIQPRVQPSAHQEVHAQYDPLLVSGINIINNICSSCTFFSEFWGLYPNKAAKKKAHQIWHSRNLDKIADTIMADVKMRTWQKPFIPLATTYLNGDRWEDEKTTRSSQRSPVLTIVEVPGAKEERWKREYLGEKAHLEKNNVLLHARKLPEVHIPTWQEFKQKRQDEEREEMQRKIARGG